MCTCFLRLFGFVVDLGLWFCCVVVGLGCWWFWYGCGRWWAIRTLASCCVDLFAVVGCFILLVALHLFAWLGVLLIVLFLNISLFGCCFAWDDLWIVFWLCCGWWV